MRGNEEVKDGEGEGWSMWGWGEVGSFFNLEADPGHTAQGW